MFRLWFVVFASFAMLSVAISCSSSSPDTSGATDAGTDAKVVDSGPDVDNGAPSTTYPAPHPDLPQLVNAAKGPVLTNPKIALVYFPCEADAGAASCDSDGGEAQLEAFAQKFASSSYWATTTSEYGVGPVTYAGAIPLTGEVAPKTATNIDLQNYVTSLLASGKLGVPDPQTIYTFIYPEGTVISETNPLSVLVGGFNSCSQFIGYHDNVSVAIGDAGAQNFPFAIIPTCSTAVSTLTEPMSHEWVEAATDPDPVAQSNGVFVASGGPNSAFFGVDGDHLVWTLPGGGEAGDLCENGGPAIDINPTDIGSTVQRTWSDLAAKANHDPCVPHVDGAYFAAAPVLTDDVSFTTTFTGSVKSKGIVVPVGASKTIEVDLFSDAATDGPITVDAQDLLYENYGKAGLANTMNLTWDRVSGLNGEKLHLTINVLSSSFLGGAHAFVIKAQIGSRYQLWPGLVVEQ
ncbi:MAG: hypothetical protein ABI183_12440 [Polyangiaceae bacterium]